MIIGLTGYAQSGKDTVAKYLIEHHGFNRIAFADKIRDLLYHMDPMVEGVYYLRTLVDSYGWEIVKQRPEIRRMLQNLGVSARDIFGENFWISQALTGLSHKENWVITDVRFINEARAIKQFENSQIWRIKRDGVKAINNHISESQMDEYKVDQIIKNEGTVEELHELISSRLGFSLNVS